MLECRLFVSVPLLVSFQVNSSSLGVHLPKSAPVHVQILRHVFFFSFLSLSVVVWLCCCRRFSKIFLYQKKKRERNKERTL